MRWKGPLLALAGALVVAGVAIGFTVGGSGAESTPAPSAADAAGTAQAPNAPPRPATPKRTATAAATHRARKSSRARSPRGGASRRAASRILVGTLDDAIKQAAPENADHVAQTIANAGFGAVLVSSTWTPGAKAPSAGERSTMSNAIHAADENGLQTFVFVWNGLSGSTPRTAAARRQFASYAAALARAFPQVRHIVVGNEPNLNTFWMPQFGRGGRDVAATAYLALLARTYDALKAVSPHIQVLGGALAPRGSDRAGTKRDTHSPTRFIEDLGAAYRASGRKKPIMDAFAIHPYMRTSKLPPTGAHADSTTITIGDYPKLVELLGQAFDSTPQRGRTLPIYYTEFGVQTRVPASHRRAYTDLTAPGAVDAVAPGTQAAYYREALELAACQPNVLGLFILHTFDEADLGGWQSGLYYADQQPKPSLGAFRKAALAARNGTLARCAGNTFVRTG